MTILNNNDAAELTDPLYEPAVRIVLLTRFASISLLKRNLCIGYNRAVHLIEQMEADGLVASMQSNEIGRAHV